MALKAIIRLKRVYDIPARDDGNRVLVDRLWPRGITKTRAKLDAWLKDVAPSGPLRKWFGHDPEKWEEFGVRYREELKKNPEAVSELKALIKAGAVTLVYGAHDTEHTHARVLADFVRHE